MTLTLVTSLCITILTWNVAYHAPPGNFSMTEAFASQCAHIPDLYAVGIQKSDYGKEKIGEDNLWINQVEQSLDQSEYAKLRTEKMQGLLIMIFVRHKHLTHITNVHAAATPPGWCCAMWGWKAAAVSIRIRLYGTSMAFVNVDFVSSGETFNALAGLQDIGRIREEHRYPFKPKQYYTHNFHFVIGNFNSRLVGEDCAQNIVKKIKEGNLTQLFSRDKMQMLVKAGANHGMTDAMPQFPPTYRFKEGTNEYDLRTRPAWCDRILYTVNKPRMRTAPHLALRLKQASYTSVPSYTLSDHKPVVADFNIKIYAVNHSDHEIYKHAMQAR